MDIHLHPVDLEITFDGIQKMYQKLFEKAGWVLLFQRDGYNDKVNSYILDIEHLLSAVVDKSKKVKEEDRREDLRIIFKNLITLLEHIKR